MICENDVKEPQNKQQNSTKAPINLLSFYNSTIKNLKLNLQLALYDEKH